MLSRQKIVCVVLCFVFTALTVTLIVVMETATETPPDEDHSGNATTDGVDPGVATSSEPEHDATKVQENAIPSTTTATTTIPTKRTTKKPPAQSRFNCSQMPNDLPRVVVQLVDGPEVLCDTVTDGGGWIVIQRRTSGDVDFYRGWAEYKNGFGDLRTNFWLGNEIIHQITSKRPYELRVDLKYKGKSYFAQYDTFTIENEHNLYRLRLGAFSSKSTTTDSLFSVHNSQAFSTFDRGNDLSGINCAAVFHGAWWYKSCHNSNLNGHWGIKTFGEGPNWYGLTGVWDVVSFSEMKIRPIDQE